MELLSLFAVVLEIFLKSKPEQKLFGSFKYSFFKAMLLIIDEISQDNVSTAKTNVIFGLKINN